MKQEGAVQARVAGQWTPMKSFDTLSRKETSTSYQLLMLHDTAYMWACISAP